MLESIRKRQRTLLMLITIVVIVAFGWIYNPASMRRAEGPGGAIGRLNGRTITIGDIQKVERSIQLIFSLGMNDLLEELLEALEQRSPAEPEGQGSGRPRKV